MSDLAPWDEAEKIDCIAAHIEGILHSLGVDLSSPSLAKTPKRVAELYVKRLFASLNPGNNVDVSLLPWNEALPPNSNHPLTLETHFQSLCEHHLVPFYGTVQVSYHPTTKVIGLSTLLRLIRHLTNRPQLQERLTIDIADLLVKQLDTPDVAVSVKGHHFCAIAESGDVTTTIFTTRALRGRYSSTELSLLIS